MAATPAIVDLSNVKEGGSFKPRPKPDGDYKAKIVKADDHQPKDKTSPKGWVLTIQVEGDARSTYPYYLSPAENQAWKIGTVCRAALLKVPAGKIKFDPNKLVGKAVGIALLQEEYNDRMKSVIDDIFPVAEVGANADEEPELEDEVIDDDEIVLDDEEDEEPEEEPEPVKPVRRRAAKPAPEPEPEEDDEEEEEEPEPTPPPRKRVARKPAPVVEEPEDDEEEDEEEPEPTPPPKKRAVRRAKPTPPPADEDDDDLDLDDLD